MVQATNSKKGGNPSNGVPRSMQVNINDVVVPRCYQHPLPDIKIAEIEKVRRTEVLTTVVVRSSLDIPGTYEICYGVLAWRTAIMADMEKIDIEVRDWLTDDEQLEMLEYDFEQSEAPDPIKEAQKIAQLKAEEGLNNTQIAEQIGRRREEVSHLLRLLKLNAQVQSWLSDGKIKSGHARALVSLEANDQIKLCREIIANNLSVRAVELAAKAIRQGQGSQPSSDNNIDYLQQQLSEHLCTEVTVQHDGPGGELQIKYYDLEILEGILEKFGIENL